MAKQWMLIEGGDVITGDGSTILRTCDVLAEGDRIVKFGSVDAETDIPRGVTLQRIDARGKTVMPGLIDAHCHMTYGLARTEEEISMYTPAELRTLIAAANIEKVLHAGVTSISQPGGSFYIGVGLREGIRQGLVHGPRMTTAGRYLTTSNGLTDWFPDTTGNPEASTGRLTNTADEMVSEIRHQVKNGVDLIKLADSPFGEFQAFSNDEMKLCADTAHRFNRRITIHARGSDEVGAAVDAGFDHIMHGNMMTDEVIDKLAQSQIPLIPTLLFMHHIVEFSHLSGIRPSIAEATKRMNEKTMDSLHRAHAAGVKFGMGTDSGFAVVPYGEFHARELELLVEYAGMTPLEAIRAGTLNNAPMVGLEGEVGEVAVGKLADLIVVDGDPSVNLKLLYTPGKITHVVLAGELQTFPDDIRTRFLRNNYLPHDYGFEVMSYERAFEGGERPVTQLDWSTEQREDLVSDLQKREHEVAAAAE
ncbi:MULTISPECIES: metal-dependent hydrolase family protein [Streptomyces]|uniref:metal-dependent hydrolase family protein n=2 Tax=Streptomyces TaxID=1883 RepID=UPI0004223AD5|nr:MULTISPECIES: amidohydrolase family protein [unclassified Streptomyces]MYS76036.1 amidohydrolase family protein [Streptomyces sp. SID5926]NEC40895.1 amidohydrolase family protein [Streptomyces sp. SID8016]NEC64679.1 amidohydrolase family protein [Streptomyces sp. SID9727]